MITIFTLFPYIYLPFWHQTDAAIFDHSIIKQTNLNFQEQCI